MDLGKNNQNTQSNLEDTQDFGVTEGFQSQNQYSQNQYNQGGYPPYNYPPQYPKNNGGGNKGLIIAVSVLAAVIVIGVAVGAVMFTSVMKSESEPQSAAVAVETEAPAPAPTVETQPIPQQPVQNTTVSRYMYVANVQNSIYLRSAPVEEDSNIITEIPLGTLVGYIEDANSTFAKINYNGTIGYSKKIYLSDSAPYVSSNNTVSHYVYVANVKNSIYLRSAPVENDSNIITEIPLGTRVGYIEAANSTFAKINYNGTIGYAKQIYLSSSSPSSGSGSSSGSTMTVVNVAHSIYLRSTPSEASDSNIITEIPLGAKVTYLGTPNGTFYKISYGGTVGYSKQIYLDFD